MLWGLSQAQAQRVDSPPHARAATGSLATRNSFLSANRAIWDAVLSACVSLEFFIDGTERRIQRPQNPDLQKQNYSGKKKCHTRKNLLISDFGRRVHYLSATCEGKKHDKRIADEEEYRFSSGHCFVSGHRLSGLCDGPHHPDPDPDPRPKPKPKAQAQAQTQTQAIGVEIQQPKKKPRGKENHLSELEKQVNRQISQVRIRVEHAINGVKRCRIVKEVLRNRCKAFDDLIMETACGLHNFRLANPSPKTQK